MSNEKDEKFDEKAVEKQEKKHLWLQNLLYRNVLTTFKRANSNPLKRFFRFLRSPRLNEARLLQKTGLVDPYYYFKKYPYTIGAGMTAAEHYVHYGALKGMNPSDNFNTLQFKTSSQIKITFRCYRIYT